MPDHRGHRGAHPDDARLFSPAALEALRQAVADLAWLQTRGYTGPSAVKLVGDRHALDARQRQAVMRSTCSDGQREGRQSRRVAAEEMRGRRVLADGYNVLTTIETALGGGVVLVGRDGACRDIAGVHGTWRKVEETPAALELVGQTLRELGVAQLQWYLDAPVSNSGRLKMLIVELAERNGWPWTVEVVPNPDPVLMAHDAASGDVVATADSVILDAGVPWVDLVGEVLRRHAPGAWVITLGEP